MFTNAAKILLVNTLIFKAVVKLLIFISPRILEITEISSFFPDIIIASQQVSGLVDLANCCFLSKIHIICSYQASLCSIIVSIENVKAIDALILSGYVLKVSILAVFHILFIFTLQLDLPVTSISVVEKLQSIYVGVQGKLVITVWLVQDQQCLKLIAVDPCGRIPWVFEFAVLRCKNPNLLVAGKPKVFFLFFVKV